MDKEIIDCVSQIIRREKYGKIKLIQHVSKDTEISRRKVTEAINYWTGGDSEGGLWKIEKQGKNKHIYKLNKHF